MAKNVLVLNGPNLNLLGTREPETYGTTTLADIEKASIAKGESLGLKVEFRQSNSEGDLVNWVQEARTGFDGLIVNAGAYTHTSVALLDALLACDIPIVEVHLSNIHQRDEFRHHSYVSKAAKGMICGFGAFGYEMGLAALANILGTTTES